MPDTQNTNDLDFMNELEAAKRLNPAWEANALLALIIGLIVCIFIWAQFAEVEVISRGQGQVIPSSETQVVQSLEGGILEELNVQEGDRVEKGQILAKIDNLAFASEERGIEAQSLGLELKKIRLNAEISGDDFNIPETLRAQNTTLAGNEMALHQSRMKTLQKTLSIADEAVRKSDANLREINATIKRLNDSKGLLAQQLKITRDLVAKNAMPKVESLKQEREFTEVSGNLNAARQRKTAMQADLSSAKAAREEAQEKFKSEALAELSEVETRLAAMAESLTAAGDRVARTELRAPSNGVVKTINQKTIGGIVEPAMRLIEITPLDDDLKVTAKIPPAEIGFLKIGQDVNVKITAYDPQKFGSLRGTLKRISADTIKESDDKIFFEIDVITEKNHLGSDENPLPINPGMVADVEIITGKRTVWEYIEKPFKRARDRALTEQ